MGNHSDPTRLHSAPIPGTSLAVGDLASGGVKYDSDKLRFDLIPPIALFELAKVYTIGARKYEDRNWEKGLKYGRVFGAMMRHAWRWWLGEERDPVDGQCHLASVMWCAAALIHFQATPECRLNLDDRPLFATTEFINGIASIPKNEVKYT